MPSFLSRMAVGGLLLSLAGLAPAAAPATASAPATADFSGDGKSDLLWINYATGNVRVWFMDGPTKLGEASLGQAEPNMALSAVASFNGDGKPDLYWHSPATGQNLVWIMDGTSVTGKVALPSMEGGAWALSGAADFLGNGQTDLVWRNYQDGTDKLWLMNGASVSNVVDLPAVKDTRWTLEAAADLNGSGQPGLAWRNFWTGQNGAFLMNGPNVARNTEDLPRDNDPNWRITGNPYVGPDGRAGLVWRNYGNGKNAAVVLDWSADRPKVDASRSFDLPIEPDTNWQLVDPVGFDPNLIMGAQEQSILDMEATTLGPGGDGFNAYDPSGVSSLYTSSGKLVLSYPPRGSTSPIFQFKKQELEATVKKARSVLQGETLISGGFMATDPVTGRPALFRASGAKEFVVSDDTWR